MCYERAGVWPFVVGVVGHANKTPSRLAARADHLNLWVIWVVKSKSVFDFCLGYPNDPQNLGAKNVGLSDEGLWAFWVASLKSSQNISYCEPFSLKNKTS